MAEVLGGLLRTVLAPDESEFGPQGLAHLIEADAKRTVIEVRVTECRLRLCMPEQAADNR